MATELTAIKLGSTPQTGTVISLTESVTDTNLTTDVQGVGFLSVQSVYTDATPAGPDTFLPADVDVVANTITLTAHGYVTGLKIALSGTNLPAGLSATNYWAIVVNANTIKVATSLANAVAGTPVDITTQGTSADSEFTAAALGNSTFACYASNDGTNWVALTSQTVTISASGSSLFRLGEPDYRYMQCRFTAPVVGALTLTVKINTRKQWVES